MMPLDVLLECMRRAWSNNDLGMAQSAAAQAAPYCHARLHSVEGKQETTVVIASAAELRERARAAIRQAFAERPLLSAPQIIEHDEEDGTPRHSTSHHITSRHDTTQSPAELNDAGLNSDDS